MDEVRVVTSKWGGRPHREYVALHLGSDEHGTWLGCPVGTVWTRPGAVFARPQATVVLVPHEGSWLVTFFDPAGPPPQGCVHTYVDITTPPAWYENPAAPQRVRPSGRELRAVDLDLDVVKGRTGRVWVDDEDEFADHRVRYGYPEPVVREALAACALARDAVASGAPPYDGHTSARWLDVLAQAMMEP